MKNLLSFGQAVKWSQFLFGVVCLFHLAVIIGIVAFDYVPLDFLWGGQMDTKEELLNFEFLSLGIMILCIVVVAVRTGRINMPKLVGVSRVLLWVLTALFLLNTVGNIVAQTTFEKSFAALTAILTVLCLRMALEKVTTS